MRSTIALLLLVLAACSAPAAARDGKDDDKNVVVVEDIVVGKGRWVENGSKVTAHYTGRLANGTEFDSSYERGRPVTFRVGRGEVIKGWDRGLIGMRVGGKRRLRVPPELAYGKKGAGKGSIPPNSTLVFEIELLRVE
jgi:FKBP-type peptidyl-prolyl cis-trans isomerase